jgi:hypothetical protein
LIVAEDNPFSQGVLFTRFIEFITIV